MNSVINDINKSKNVGMLGADILKWLWAKIMIKTFLKPITYINDKQPSVALTSAPHFGDQYTRSVPSC